jgi:SAM-dependent methyltransferase
MKPTATSIILPYLKKIIAAYGAIRRRSSYAEMSRAGVNPFVSYSTTSTQFTIEQARESMGKDHLFVPNVSGFYHGILRNFWGRYGLEKKCLLVSETKAVSEVFGKIYPDTQFLTTDYYLQLQPNPLCDVVWDLCSQKIPSELSGFTSVINQATMEHVRDPVQVMRNMAQVLQSGGYLYVQTHTPSFYYHGYPRDYLRFFPDWFQDIPDTLGNIILLELLCVDGHAFAVYQKR